MRIARKCSQTGEVHLPALDLQIERRLPWHQVDSVPDSPDDKASCGVMDDAD